MMVYNNGMRGEDTNLAFSLWKHAPPGVLHDLV